MIFDFNVAYSQKGYTDKDLMPPVSFGCRAAMATSNLITIPTRLLASIIKLAKIIFFAIASALVFGQSRNLNEGFTLANKQFVLDIATAVVSTLGLFAPCNSCEWQKRVIDIYTHSLQDRNDISIDSQRVTTIF